VSENEAALLANITTSEAKEYLESLVKKGAAEMKYRKFREYRVFVQRIYKRSPRVALPLFNKA
jgi:hypothetical protein